MNDQLILDNYLLILKSTVEVYVHGTLESVNEKVRTLLKQCLDNTMSMQDTTYQEMTKNGWYVIENIKAKEIEKVLNKINSQN